MSNYINMDKKKLILTVGIPDSGKTFYARNFVNESPTTRIRINNDDIRNMLGPYWVPEREDLVSNTKRNIALYAIHQGYDIIVDNMNLNPKEIKFWQDIVDFHNSYLKESRIEQPDRVRWEYEIEFKYFLDTPLEECIRRDSLRENPIGEIVIRNIYEKYKDLINNA